MRLHTLAALLCALATFGSSKAFAEAATVNLHLEPGAAIPLNPPASDPRVGADVAVKVDVPVFHGLAVQLQGAGVTFPSSRLLGVPSALGAFGGLRYRILNDKKGYFFGENPEGNLFGNLWVDASAGFWGLGRAVFGFDAGLGVELSLVDGLQIGPFVKFMRIDSVNLAGVGLSLSFGFPDDSAPPKKKEVDDDPDKDGIRGTDDKCPNDPEDKDGFQDDDGCPDLDNDNDGIPDVKDKCPNDPEDKDGFEDEDGCPDLDNDKDGIPDAQDKCPNDPEDKDGFQDEDGCPDLDNDGDGIPDVKDKCPNDPETFNGIADDDGCPEKEVKVFIEKSRIVITEKVFFEFNKATILPKSFGLLTNVADVLKKFPQVKKLRVEGHTDDVGNDAYNFKLSDKRAQAVMKFLIDKGVDASRLEFKGYGKSKPLQPGTSTEARDKNRRVEFIIVEPAEGFVPVIEEKTETVPMEPTPQTP